MFFEAVDREPRRGIDIVEFSELLLYCCHGGFVGSLVLGSRSWRWEFLFLSSVLGRVQIFFHLGFLVGLFLCRAFGVVCFGCFEDIVEAGFEGEHAVAQDIAFFVGGPGVGVWAEDVMSLFEAAMGAFDLASSATLAPSSLEPRRK